MFKSILENFFNGKINPSEHSVPFSREREAVNKKVQEEKGYFRKILSPEDYNRLNDLENLYTESSNFVNVETFKHGFTLGALMITEVFLEQEGLANE